MKRSLSLSILLALVFTATADVPPSQGSISAIEVTSLTRDRVALWARALLPAVAVGSKQTFTGEVAVANVALPVERPIVVVVQPKGKDSEAVFFLDLDLKKTPNALLTKASTHAIDLTLKGILEGEKGSKAPVCAVGVLKIGTPEVHAPAGFVSQFVKFGGAKLTGLSFTETSGEARAVLFNPFSFPVPMKELTYALYSGDRKLCEGTKRSTLIHPNRENEIVLPLTAGNADLIAVAGSVMSNGGAFEGRLIASITVKVGNDEITIPVDMPGKIQVVR